MTKAQIPPKYRPRQPVQIGERFGRLVVTAEAGWRAKKDGTGRVRLVRVRCDCGTEKVMVPSPLRPGVVVSCGCYRNEMAAEIVERTSVTHGDCRVGKRAPEYGVYRTMLSRCYNPNVERYPQYGGRGIEVCDRWRGDGGYENFIADMGRRPDGYSIERQDRDGNYVPDNCIWAPEKVQSRNRTNNRYITFGDETLTLVEWAERIGVRPITIHQRVKAGWPMEKALTAPTFGKGVQRKGAAPGVV